MTLEQFDRILKARVVAAAILYAAFVVVAIYATLTGSLMSNPTPSIVLMVLSYLLIPRRALPKNYQPEDQAEADFAEARFELEKKLQKSRLALFVSAVILLALVPFLMGEPIFQTT